MVPKKVFFTKGVGKHKHQLQSFELALRSAGIEKCNIVNVSSIVPPNCKILTREKGIQDLKIIMVIFLSIIVMVKPLKKQGIMRKIWQHLCLQQL